MGWDILLRGLIIGFSIAAPVGPIGVLCVRRTLSVGFAGGLVSGLGAATADAIYGVIAGFGLTVISNILINQQNIFRLVGGLFLLYLGVKIFFTKTALQNINAKDESFAGMYGSTFFLTLTNPVTILAFGAIFAGLGVVSDGGNYTSAVTLVLGVFIGSALWWVVLSAIVNLFRERFSIQSMRWVNKMSGIIIGVFGVVALLSSL